VALVHRQSVGALAALGFAAVVVAWTIAFFIPFFTVGNKMLKVGLVLTAVAVVIEVARRHREISARLNSAAPFVLAAIALLIWLTASVLWSADPVRSLAELWKYPICLGIFVALATLVRKPATVRLLVAAFVAGALITALAALAGFSGGPVNSLPAEGRIQGGTGDPNVLAAAMIAATALAAGLMTGTRRVSLRLALLACIAVFGLAAAGSGSRGGIIAAVVAILSALIVMRGGRRAVFGMAAFVLVAGAFQVLTSSSDASRLTSFGDRSDGRDELWRIGWEMFVDHPLVGVGLNNYVPSAPEYVLHPGGLNFIHLIVEKPVVVHNTYLQFLAETGVVGFLLFSLLVCLSLAASLRAARLADAAGDPAFGRLCRCLFVAAIALLSAGFFISAAVDYKLWLILGLGPAALMAAGAKEAVPGSAPPRA
jgi:oligosaccharide repeat unit polymerase